MAFSKRKLVKSVYKIEEFLAFAASHASPARIPAGSRLCVDIDMVGADGVWQYLYGTTGAKCTQSLLDRKYTQYYHGWGWSKAEYAAATAGWVEKGVTVCDCQGVEDYFAGRDTNAKGNYANLCTDKGRIKDITRPYVLGEAIFCGSSPSSINHIGWIAGFAPDGEALVLHERGLSHGCVIERMSQSGKSWTYRGLMTKRYVYDGVEAEGDKEDTEMPTILKITSPLMRGDAILSLQEALNGLGYPCGKEDGIYGEDTEAALLDFCKDYAEVGDADAALPEVIEVSLDILGKTYTGALQS